MKNAKATDVLEGRAKWSAECADALAWLRSLPDDSLDLLFTSPPYELARTYGVGERMVGGEDWVRWMFDVVSAAAPKVKGLIAVNCEGQTRGYSYSGVPFLLFADLKRAGFNMRKLPVFKRVGIPGSGGPDWLRNDWEPIVCVTRPGRLPWSDNTACGHAPKWAPGGAMAHRLTNGTRINQWGKTGSKTGTTATGNKEKPTIGPARPSHVTMTKREGRRITKQKEGMHTGQENTVYTEPAIANPGNVISVTVGGGQMGHPCAHDNEAPFPLKLAEFFVLSFCPPGGVACDPFAGSGTVAHAALLHGRRFVGADLRQSQCDLTARRLSTVTPNMFASPGAAS